MAAADNARKNSEARAEELEGVLRVLRQDQITRELLDLVAGQLIDEGPGG
jgi:F0F1-type ATP synthase gamma subunit